MNEAGYDKKNTVYYRYIVRVRELTKNVANGPRAVRSSNNGKRGQLTRASSYRLSRTSVVHVVVSNRRAVLSTSFW